MKEIPDEHFIGNIGQKAIITDGNKVLIVRDVWDEAKWDLPGGRLHKNETLVEGLKREVLEEMGVEIEIGKLIYAESYIRSRDNLPTVLLAYSARFLNPEKPFAIPSEEIAEAQWIEYEKINTVEIYGSCLRAIQTYFKTKTR